MFYLNTNRPLVINSEIIEWDIKSANISLIKEYSLLPESIIKKIPIDNKEKREKYVGILMRDNKDFSKNLEKKFDDVINEFISQNTLDKDYDIIGIKRDAVFVVSKKINYSKIGDNIVFVPKNIYHAYRQLPHIEFYFGKNLIDVKGLSKDFEDTIFPLHKNGMIYFIYEAMNICENSNMNKNSINLFMKDFVEKYKKKELDYDFYREFNQSSKFKCNMFNQELLLDNIDESLMESLNIEYNYINVIIPLIRIMC